MTHVVAARLRKYGKVIEPPVPPPPCPRCHSREDVRVEAWATGALCTNPPCIYARALARRRTWVADARE